MASLLHIVHGFALLVVDGLELPVIPACTLFLVNGLILIGVVLAGYGTTHSLLWGMGEGAGDTLLYLGGRASAALMAG